MLWFDRCQLEWCDNTVPAWPGFVFQATAPRPWPVWKPVSWARGKARLQILVWGHSLHTSKRLASLATLCLTFDATPRSFLVTLRLVLKYYKDMYRGKLTNRKVCYTTSLTKTSLNVIPKQVRVTWRMSGSNHRRRDTIFTKMLCVFDKNIIVGYLIEGGSNGFLWVVWKVLKITWSCFVYENIEFWVWTLNYANYIAFSMSFTIWTANFTLSII